VKTSGTPPATASTSASARASADPVATDTRPTASATAAASGERMVRFQIEPRTATLTIDNQAVTPGAPISLKVGPHTAMITPQPGDTSCEPWSSPSAFQVPARADGEPEIWLKKLGLTFRPAKVTLKNAPAGGVAQCATVTLAPTAEVKMDKAVWTPNCKFIHEGKVIEASVSFEAGKSKDAFWPSGG
jgi:hypothetical protein